METPKRSRVGRGEWAKRVERWQDSGLTASEFASELGINAGTLKYWKYALGKEARGQKRGFKPRTVPRRLGPSASARPAKSSTVSGLVQINAAVADERFELELGAGRRLRVPKAFDADALRRLLSVLEAP